MGSAKNSTSMAFVLGAPPTPVTGQSSQAHQDRSQRSTGQRNSKTKLCDENQFHNQQAKNMHEHEWLIRGIAKAFLQHY